MIIGKLKGNFKRGVNTELGMRTLVVGQNKSGKTSIVQAARLVLEGRLDSFPAPSDLMLLATGPDAKELRLDAFLSEPESNSGQAVNFSIEGTTAKASRPRFSGPYGVVLSDVVSALMSERPKALREKLLAACAPEKALAAAEGTLPESFRVHWRDAVARARAAFEKDGEAAPPEADLVVVAADLLRKDLRQSRKVVSAAEKDENRPEPIDQAALDAAKARVSDAEQVIEVLRRVTAASERIASLRTELRTALARAQEQGVALPSRTELEAAKRRLEGAKALTARLREKGGACLACGGHPAPEALDEASRMQAAAEIRLKDVEAKLKATVSPNSRSVNELESELSELSEQLAADQTWLAGRTQTEPEAEHALTEARLAQGLLLQKAAIYNAWNEARAAGAKAKAKVEELAAVVKTVDRAVKEILFDAVDSFTARVNAALPHGYKADVSLYDGGRSICRVTLCEPNDAPREWRTLSGAQRAMLAAAVADAWAGEVDGAVKLVVVDEVWVDRYVLPQLCAAVGQVIGKAGGATQAIITAVEYDGPPIPGWQIVRLPEAR